MTNIIHNFFDLRRNEYTRFALMSAYLFVVIASYNVLKPMTRSLFVSNLGLQQLPFLYMLLAVAVGLFVTTYLGFSARIRLDKLIIRTTLLLVISLVLFWWLLRIAAVSTFLYYGLFIWASIYGVLTTTQYWLLANYVFNVREAKRVFPLLTASGLLGGISGGYATRFLVKSIGGTANLAFICMGLLLIVMILAKFAWGKRDFSLSTSRRLQGTRNTSATLRILPELYGFIKESRHLAYLIAIVALTFMVVQIADFQFLAFAAEEMGDADELTGFLGFWLSNLSIFALAFQLLFANSILRRFGVGTMILFLPMALLITSVGVFAAYGLVSVLALKIGDGAFRHSINKVGLELLYLPIPPGVKRKTKAFIDIFVDRFARGTAGFLLLVAYVWLGLTVPQLSLVILFLVLIWIALALATHKAYVNSFRQAIAKRRIDSDQMPGAITDKAIIDSLIFSLSSDNDRQIVYALGILKATTATEFEGPVRPLLHHHSADVRLHALRLIYEKDLKGLLPEIAPLTGDAEQTVRREAVKTLVELSEQQSTRLIAGWLDSADKLLRSAALHYLAEKPDLAGRYITIDVIESFMAGGPEGRAEMAHALGTVNDARFRPYMAKLLRDPEVTVRAHAIESLPVAENLAFLNIVLESLSGSSTRKVARIALARLGEAGVSELEPYLTGDELAPSCKVELLKVLATIGSQKSIEILLGHLHESSGKFRFQIIKALNKLRANFPDLVFDSRVDDAIVAEVRQYSLLLAPLRLSNPAAANGSASLLQRSIQERMEEHVEVIFRLLGLRYPARDIYNAFAATTSRKGRVRANAIEFLDNILSKEYRKLLLPIVEKLPAEQALSTGEASQAQMNGGRRQALRDLLQVEDAWLRACTLYEIGHSGLMNDFKPEVERAHHSANAIVRETAELVLKRFA